MTWYHWSIFSIHILVSLPLRFHLSSAEDTLAKIEDIAGGAMTELIEDEDKNAHSTTYPTLTRCFSILELVRKPIGVLFTCIKQLQSYLTVFPFNHLVSRSSLACYYRAMMEELIGSVKQTHSVPLKRTDSPEVACEHILFLSLTRPYLLYLVPIVTPWSSALHVELWDCATHPPCKIDTSPTV